MAVENWRGVVEYYYKRFRIEATKGQDYEDWDWMVEDEHGPVYWHTTSNKPTIEDVRTWIDAQDWA